MPLVHPELLNSIPERWPSTCRIEIREEGTDEYGQPVDDWVTFVDEEDFEYEEISAVRAPSGGREIKQDDKTYTVSELDIVLKGYYPKINETMRAVINNAEIYNILLVENSSQDEITRLAVEKVR